ncbi:MAG: NADH-quinone oxidoreductase subunit 5 family protein [Pseudonocardia sp.]
MLAWSVVLLPLVAGALLAVAGCRADPAASVLGIVVATGVLGLAVAATVVRPVVDAPFLAGIRVGLAVDGLSALMVVIIGAVTVAVLVFAAGEGELRTSRFVGLVLMFAAAMLITVTATTLLMLLMAWELMGAMSWALIGYQWREPDRVAAGHIAFLTTRAGDVGLYLAAGAALAGGVGSLSLVELAAAEGPWLHVLVAGVVVAAVGKSAQLPFSFWLSRAMQGPSPVSALLHSATMVAAGAYLLLRLAPTLTASGWGDIAVAWVGAATAVLLGLVAVAQADLKQLLAASTCAQIGFMVLAAGVGAVGAGALQLVAHAATKSLLFLAAGAWLVAVGTKQLGDLRGAARRFPLVGVTFTIGAASLAGLPPLSLWVSKDAVLAGALERSPTLYAAGQVAAVVSAVYATKAVWFVWQRPREHPAPGSRPVAESMRPPLVALAGAAAGAGLLTVPLTVEPAPAGWELTVSAVLAVVAVAVAWRLTERLPVPRPLADWLGLERAARLVVVRPTFGLARVLARFDDEVLDRGVATLAGGTLAAAALLHRRAEPFVDGAVGGVATGARALGRSARRPQTGQIHQYYAQACVGVAALALLTVLVVVVR